MREAKVRFTIRELAGLTEHSGGRFGLSIESAGEETYFFFNEHGMAGDGCSWHAVVDSLLRSKMPRDINGVQLNSEAGGLLIISSDRGLLERISALIKRAIRSERSIAKAIKNAKPELLE